MGREGMIHDSKDRFPVVGPAGKYEARNVKKPVGRDYGEEAAEYDEQFHARNMQTSHDRPSNED